MPLAELIKQPRSLEEADVDSELIVDLTLKHLYDGGSLDLGELAERMAIAGIIVEAIVDELRNDFKIKVITGHSGDAYLRYQLTDLGRTEAQHALSRSAYIGRTPITINHYRQLVAEQSVFKGTTSKAQLMDDFADVVIEEYLLDQLGPAIHSGRAIMVYGIAGSGKTYICKRLAHSLGGPIYLPYAICVCREIIQFFDPLIHNPVCSVSERQNFQFQTQTDKRLILCDRPLAVSGGELTLDSLGLQYDSLKRFNQAPIQMKANNGLYIVDDLGRQRISAVELFNRWIVPMEEHLDYLTLGSGQHFPVPFDVVLIFSTNIDPHDLVDEAFLRRLGYKIKFTGIDREAYVQIWSAICADKVLQLEADVLDQVIQFYETKKRPFLPCQPRDLLDIASNIATFTNQALISKEHMLLAWNTYFIDL